MTMSAFFRQERVIRLRIPREAAPRTDEEVRQLLRLLPKYRVLLHNDDENTMDHVVATLLRTVPLSYQDAVRVMLEAHTNDVAEVIVCPREQAEHYCDGLGRHGLKSTIEPA